MHRQSPKSPPLGFALAASALSLLVAPVVAPGGAALVWDRSRQAVVCGGARLHWSPSGDAADGAKRLFRWSVGEAPQLLWQGADEIRDLEVSRDGKIALRVVSPEGGSRLEVIDRTGRSTEIDGVLDFSWAPSANKLVYVKAAADRTGDGPSPAGVFLHELDRGTEELLSDEGDRVSWAWFDGRIYIETSTGEVRRYSLAAKSLDETPYRGIEFSRLGRYYFHAAANGAAWRLYERRGNSDITHRLDYLGERVGASRPDWISDDAFVAIDPRSSARDPRSLLVDVTRGEARSIPSWDVTAGPDDILRGGPGSLLAIVDGELRELPISELPFLDREPASEQPAGPDEVAPSGFLDLLQSTQPGNRMDELEAAYSLTEAARDDILRELVAQRAKWEAAGVDSYDVTFRALCNCGPADYLPKRLRVRHGRLVDWAFEASPELESPSTEQLAYGLTEPLTVEQVFLEIERATRFGAANVRVEYDAAHGYPRSVRIDRQAMTIDDEIEYELSDLEAVPATADSPDASAPAEDAQLAALRVCSDPLPRGSRFEGVRSVSPAGDLSLLVPEEVQRVEWPLPDGGAAWRSRDLQISLRYAHWSPETLGGNWSVSCRTRVAGLPVLYEEAETEHARLLHAWYITPGLDREPLLSITISRSGAEPEAYEEARAILGSVEWLSREE